MSLPTKNPQVSVTTTNQWDATTVASELVGRVVKVHLARSTVEGAVLAVTETGRMRLYERLAPNDPVRTIDMRAGVVKQIEVIA